MKKPNETRILSKEEVEELLSKDKDEEFEALIEETCARHAKLVTEFPFESTVIIGIDSSEDTKAIHDVLIQGTYDGNWTDLQGQRVIEANNKKYLWNVVYFDKEILKAYRKSKASVIITNLENLSSNPLFAKKKAS